MSEQNAEKRPITPGKIKAPLRGEESAVVCLCVHSEQHGTKADFVELLEDQKRGKSAPRTAPFAAWRTGSQIGTVLSMSARKAAAGPTELRPGSRCARPSEPAHGLD